MKVSKKLQRLEKQGLYWVFNKYSVSFIFFMIWMIFFDHHKISDQIQLSQTVRQLENEKDQYAEKIVQIKKDRADIETNREKYAREKFYMHKPGEEVYIVRDEN